MSGGLKDLNPKSLPSWTDYYDKFDDANENECGSIVDGYKKLKSTLEDKLNAYLGLKALAGTFTKAYCRACTMKKDSPQDNTACHFFHHWLGKEITVDEYKNKLSGIVGKIYEALGSFFSGNMCNIIYKDIDNDEDLFKHRKEVFDYYYNYTDVKQYLEQNTPECEENWLSYRYNIDEACEKVKKYCAPTGEGIGDEYCSWFNDEKVREGKDYCDPNELSKLKCKEQEKPSPDVRIGRENSQFTGGTQLPSRDSMVDAKEVLEDDPLKNLPSKGSLYRPLNWEHIHTDCDNETERENVQRKLKQCPKDEAYAKKITGAWCYVDKELKKGNSEDKFCALLYFWMGNIVSSELCDRSYFSEHMKNIYDELKGMGIENTCENMDKDKSVDGHTFSNMKTVYEYFEDFSTLQTHLGKYKKDCDSAYKEHIQKITEACDAIRPKCQGRNNDGDPLCTWFNKQKNKDYCNTEKLKELQCNTGTTRVRTAAELHQSVHGGETLSAGTRSRTNLPSTTGTTSPGSVVTTAVSTILPTAGLPALAYLLYKYDLLPSGIKNSFFGGGGKNRSGKSRRKGRSAGPTFSTLTVDTSIAASTYDSMDGSTTIGSSSNLTTTAAPATVDSSTIDDGTWRPISRGRNNNNARQKNIRYQRM